MLHWSITHKIPINLDGSRLERTHMFTIGSEVFIVIEKFSHGHHQNPQTQIEMFVFKPGFDEVQKVDCPFSELNIDKILSIVCSDDQAYIWFCRSLGEFRGPVFLYKLDMKTLQFKSIFSLMLHEYYMNHTPIIGDLMYVLTGKSNDTVIVINLKTKTLVESYVLQKPVVGSHKYTHDLVAHDGNLYLLLRSTVDNERIMSIVENQRATWLVKDDNDDGFGDVISRGNWMDGSVFNAQTNSGHDCGSIDTFDFKEMHWVRQNTERGWFINYNLAIRAWVKFDGTIYAVFHTVSERTDMMEIRVMDPVPQLSTICLRVVVEEILGDATGESLRNAENLPILSDLKEKLGNMLNWRLDEIVAHENYDLYEQQNLEILKVLCNMMHEELIDENLTGTLISFVSNKIPDASHLYDQ